MKIFNLYCDESSHLPRDRHPYMLVGYVGTAYHQLKQHKAELKRIRTRHGLHGEVKWSQVSAARLPFYQDLIAYFFASELQFRAVVVDKAQIDARRPGHSFNEFYFKMYYQLLHHKLVMGNAYNIYLDLKDTRSQDKIAYMRPLLQRDADIRNLQFMRSHESGLMQLADLLLGAVNYRLRGALKSPAKVALVEQIEGRLGQRLDQSTPKHHEKFNLFFINLK